MRIKKLTDEERLDRAIRAYRDAKWEAEEAQNRANLAKAELTQIMFDLQVKTSQAKDGGKYFQATVVQPADRVSIDQDGIESALTAKEYAAITNTVTSIDKKKLEDAMDDQAMADKVLPFLKATPSKPYIRFTEGAVDDSEDSE